jgi:hypothetical protein
MFIVLMCYKKDTDDKYPRKMFGQIKFSSENHPETAVFSPDGNSLVTGKHDPLVLGWERSKCL